jgi:hypothetical protein
MPLTSIWLRFFQPILFHTAKLFLAQQLVERGIVAAD